jgi:hypothetical protein
MRAKYHIKSDNWSQPGNKSKTKKEESTYKKANIILNISLITSMGLVVICIYRLINILYKNNSYEQEILWFFVFLLFIYWMNNFVPALKQLKLNQSLYSFVKGLHLLHNKKSECTGKEENLKQKYEQYFIAAEEYLKLKPVRLNGIIRPSDFLRENTALARRLLEPIECGYIQLSSEQKIIFEGLNQREMKLLSHRVSADVKCKHSKKGDSDFQESPFILIKNYRNTTYRDGSVRSLIWCKFCLVSFWQQRKIPDTLNTP